MPSFADKVEEEWSAEGASILPSLRVEQEQYCEDLKSSDEHEKGKEGQGWTR